MSLAKLGFVIQNSAVYAISVNEETGELLDSQFICAATEHNVDSTIEALKGVKELIKANQAKPENLTLH